MQNKIIILKNTKNGIVKDTIISTNDTLNLDLRQEIIIPDDIVVKTITDPPSGIQYWGSWVALIGGVIGMFVGIKAIVDLFKRSDNQQNQINELIKLNQLFEKRVRMTVKPHLWTNGSGYNGTDSTIHIKIDNRGEICFYTGFTTLEGDSQFSLQEWNSDITIKKDGYMQLSGRTTDHPKDTYFKIKISYNDREGYEYETIIEWNKGNVRFLETIEL